MKKEKLQYNVWYSAFEHMPENFDELDKEENETEEVLCENEYKGQIYYDMISRYAKPTENEFGQACRGNWEWNAHEVNVTYWMAVKH